MERKVLLAALSVFLMCSPIFARKFPGKIYFEKDTQNVVFDVPMNMTTQDPDYEQLQFKVKYLTQDGKKAELDPNTAKGICFNYGPFQVKMMSVNNDLKLGPIVKPLSRVFLKQEIDGAVKVYSYYFAESAPGLALGQQSSPTNPYSYGLDSFILCREEGNLTRVKALNFKNEMSAYFSDCPGVVSRLESRAWKERDLATIVDFYNRSCKR